MMLDIVMCITFLPVQKYTQLIVSYARILKKTLNINNQKVQVTDEIKRDILNIWYNLSWQMVLDIIMYITFFPMQNKYPATRFICQNFDGKNCILIIKRYK